MAKIELVLPKGHQDINITPGIEREMKDVQRELDDKGSRLSDGKIHFIISKGFYKHEEGTLTIASVIVNKTNTDINAITMDMKFALKNYPNAEIAPMNASLNECFLGLVKNNQAFILHMDVPVQNIGNEDATFQPNEIKGKLENMEYHYINE